MKASRTIATALALIVVVGILAVSAQAAGIQDKKQEAKPAPKASSMPKEIAAVIQEGLATRQGRQDIPFSFFDSLVLPALAQNAYAVFFFKARNGDLGYAPSAAGTGEMETTLNAFFQFFQEAEGGTLAPKIAGRAPCVLSTEGAGYSPENEDWYSFGIALAPGKYTLALALASPDMKKLSVSYTDVTLPGPEAYATTLWATEIIVVKAVEQVEQEQRPVIHRGHFIWGAAKVVPNIRGDIAAGEELDILFFVLGGSYKDPQTQVNEFEVNFEVQYPDGKPAIKWAPGTFERYLINQPLELNQNLQKLDEKGTVLSQEKKPLEPGKYNLAVTVLDKVSGKKTDAKTAFSIR